MMSIVNKRPDTSQASRVGDPTLVDSPLTSAREVVEQASKIMTSPGAASGNNTAAVETVGHGAPPAGGEVPRSDNPSITAVPPPTPDAAAQQPTETEPAPGAANAQPDANELRPNVASDQPDKTLPAPTQVNQIDPNAPQPPAQATANNPKDDDEVTFSSSKHKKKKGLRKVVPF